MSANAMTQSEARQEAKRLNQEQPLEGHAWVATTEAAMSGQFEPTGVDAYRWTVTVVEVK